LLKPAYLSTDYLTLLSPASKSNNPDLLNIILQSKMRYSSTDIKILTRLFILATVLASSLPMIAQPTDCLTNRYQKQVFNSIRITNNITYGSAQNVLGQNQSLELDFYEPNPSEEYLEKRPLVLMFFGGSFVTGSKNDTSIETWCDSLAHMGYACAAVEYRLDNVFNFALPNQGVRAAYRAIQDGRAAIRFLLEDPNNFGFNIAPDYIYTGGESAGAITAIHIAYLDETERPTETFNSDMGCLDCSGNNYVQPFSIAGIIDLWGATLDLDYIDKVEDVPMVIIHGDNDNVVPYTSGSPFNIALLPTVYGAVPLDNKMNTENIAHQFYPYLGEGHTIYGSQSSFPNQFWKPIFTQSIEFIYNKTLFFNSPMPVGKQLVCEGAVESYTASANLNSIFCWEVVNGNIISTNSNQVTVQWNNSPGYLSLTETKCIDVSGETQTIEITPYILSPSTLVTDASSSINNNGSIDLTVSGGFPPYQYSWSTGDATQDLNALASGMYSVTITDINGCITTLNDIEVGNSCPDILVQTNNPNLSSVTEQVLDYIISNGRVLAGNEVNFKAGNSITLQKGFSVYSQAEFSAYIEGCP